MVNSWFRFSVRWLAAVAVLAALQPGAVPAAIAAAPTDITGPTGSGQFGQTVTALPNGNIVVTDPAYSTPVTTSEGAAYLYNGAARTLISTLTGSSADDQVGSGGVLTLTNRDYVVVSPNWANGGTAAAGAVTWCSGTLGCSGAVSAGNSLVGNQANDQVGSGGVVALANGRYVVRSYNWANGPAFNAGAVTWCPAIGCTGVLSPASSLVGSVANDLVGIGGVVPLGSGAYAVVNSNWDSGAKTDVGAVTWCPVAGCLGMTVASGNSLVGSTANDLLGSAGWSRWAAGVMW